jgi:hypothetical protein
MIGKAKVELAITRAAIQQFRQDGISPIDAATMILAIEMRNIEEFEEAEPGTFQLMRSAKVKIAGMLVYEDIESQQILVTDRQIGDTSKYKYIGRLNLYAYAIGKCKALGLDIDNLRV